MHLITLGNRGYLKECSGAPQITATTKEAREVSTKKQASRHLDRVARKFPDFDVSDAKIDVSKAA